MKTILYFEPLIPEHVEVIQTHTPEGYEIAFWQLLNEAEREAALLRAEFFFIVAHQTTKDWIDRAPRLRHIQRSGIGCDNVDVAAADSNGVTVSNLPTGNATAVAEHAILLPLALYRRLMEVNEDTKAGAWPVWQYRSTSYEMDGKVHGFIGMGNIGRLTAARSRAFGTRVIYYDVYRLPAALEAELGVEYMSKEAVIANADILSLHVPLLPENVGMIGSKELAAMKPGALLINVSRGGLIDEDALYDALVEKRLGGAGIDTWAAEPCRENRLFSLKNVIATSHVAAGTIDTFAKQVKAGFANIVQANDGHPDHTVGMTKTTKPTH